LESGLPEKTYISVAVVVGDGKGVEREWECVGMLREYKYIIM
jgi:hypothetical protein